MGSSAPQQPPRVLVVGSPGSGKHCLVQQLVGREAAKGAGRYALALDTRYYAAEVELEPLRLGGAGDSLNAPPDLGAYEALLLVFDAASEAS